MTTAEHSTDQMPADFVARTLTDPGDLAVCFDTIEKLTIMATDYADSDARNALLWTIELLSKLGREAAEKISLA